MKVILQYVSTAQVTVRQHPIAQINTGYLLLVGFSPQDTPQTLAQMAQKIVNLRAIPDQNHHLNLSIKTVNGDILVVPQFTLYANTQKGHRPGFSKAAPPQVAQPLFNTFITTLKSLHPATHTGQFGAKMQVKLVNDGPITLALEN